MLDDDEKQEKPKSLRKMPYDPLAQVWKEYKLKVGGKWPGINAPFEHRHKRGRPFIGEEDETNEAQQPWRIMGMSRATWYLRRRNRRLKEERERSRQSEGKSNMSTVAEINHDIARIKPEDAARFIRLWNAAISSGDFDTWRPLDEWGIRRIERCHHTEDRKLIVGLGSNAREYPIG